MLRLTAVSLLLFCVLAASPARAQGFEKRPELITHVTAGPVFGFRFGGGRPFAFTIGFEVSPIHAFQGCSAWDPSPFVGLALGGQYAFSEGAFIAWAEVEGGYIAGAFTPGIGIGPTLTIDDDGLRFGVQSTQFLGMMGQVSESWDSKGLRVQAGPLTKVPFFMVPGCGGFG